HNVLHLDVKPANVLLGQAAWPLVADLGLTQAIARRTSESTGQVRIAGTPAYMSPEQCRGDAVDGRSDEYSLAVTAFELLTGRRPFQAGSTEGLLEQHIQTPPPSPRTINPGIPGPVEDVLLRGLAKAPEDRYASIGEFGHSLAQAIEQTRGVSLEAKQAAAAATPNVLAVLGLVLAAPFLLAILPVGTLFGRLPLAWPFQLVLAGAIAGLLFGIRWHLIGLCSRGIGAALPAGWRHAGRASAEGIVNLLYLVAMYRLVGGPLLGILSTLVDEQVYRLVTTGLAILVGVLALVIVARLFRSAGPLPALLVLTLGWTLAIILPTGELQLEGAQALAAVAQLVVGGGLLVLLLAQRATAAGVLAAFVGNHLGRLLVEARPGISPEQANASRQQLARLTATLLDFGLLLLGYTLLRQPVLDLLGPVSSPLAAAIVASGAACGVWLVLIIRLRWIAGVLGLLLGLVLGAPMLVSLPLLDATLLQVGWPATVATWLAAAALLVLLAAVRGPTQTFSQTIIGARVDRALLGTRAAPSESQSVRRVSALGRVITALVDVGFLLVLYWVIGVPLTSAVVRATGQPVFSSLILAVVLLLAIASVVQAARRAASTLAESAGAQWRNRARALVAFAAACAALLVAVGAAAPASVAGPTVVSAAAFTPDNEFMTRGVDQVVVDRDVWLPWSPTTDQATYTLSLSCSNGQPIGQFREAFTPASGAAMPAGPVGITGATSVPCDDWQQVFAAHRRAAGLPDTTSYSWDSLDVQASINADGSVDVTQTHNVFFSAGHHSSLSWNLGPSDGASIDDVQVSDSGLQYQLVAPGAAHTSARYAQLVDVGGQRILTWNFPDLAAPAERKFGVRYRLGPRPGTSPSVLFQQSIIPADHTQPIWSATVQVQLPAGADTSAVRASSTGVFLKNARSGLLDPATVIFAADNVAAGNGLDVVVANSTNALSADVTH
ncbi:MAG: serine/threonine protein kinase, partial [Chloroflexi bacterium]|nr:serine/threonine protein kinase [Chloroflexota bacterium]